MSNNQLGEYSIGAAIQKLRDDIAILTDELCETHNIHKYSVKGKTPICEMCQRIENEERLQKRISANLQWEYDRRTSKVLKLDSIVDDPDIFEATIQSFEAKTSEEKAALEFANKTVEFYKTDGIANTLLTGKQGTGKSHLAMGMAKEINKRGDLSILFVSFPRVVQLVQAAIGFPEAQYSYENMLKLLKDPDILVLDDVGRERRVNKGGMSYGEDILVSILNGRKNTIITTNYSSTDLGGIYCRATASRIIKDVGRSHAFVFKDITDKRIANEEPWW